MSKKMHITGNEIHMPKDQFIVSKTDIKGTITYCNKLFIEMSGYCEDKLIGAPHSILRHPDMPRCVFKLLWDTVAQGKEIFAFVKNRCKNGDHYWVNAHVTPTFDEENNIIGYHSNRRCPEREAIEAVAPIYAELLSIEQNASDRKAGLEQSFNRVVSLLNEKNVSYDEFIFSLHQQSFK